MTQEQLKKGKYLNERIVALGIEIENLQYILTDETDEPIDSWILQIRPNETYTPRKIDHRGLLRKFISDICDKAIEEKTEAERQFRQL